MVDLDPVRGSEIQKKRPCVVISSDAVGKLPVKLVAPITEWKDHYARNIWHIRIDPDQDNGLTKPSVVDALQIRTVAFERFESMIGYLLASTMETIIAAIAAVIEFTWGQRRRSAKSQVAVAMRS
jgi:mRNA interferase MazF